MFSEIAEIKSIREQKLILSEREAELTAPTFTDLDMIGQLYEWFKEVLSHRNCPPRPESVTQRKKFIFIVLFFYSPSTLAGGKMAKGLREKLSEVLDVNAPSAISDNVSSAVFFYQQYEKDFRQDVDWVFFEVMKRIKPED